MTDTIRDALALLVFLAAVAMWSGLLTGTI